jgi:hypothetical protein
MRPGETDTAGRKWTPTPPQMDQTTGSIQGVLLYPGEDVEWTWSADGRQVIGYTTRNHPKILNPLTCPKCKADLVHDEHDAYNRCLSCGWYGSRT